MQVLVAEGAHSQHPGQVERYFANPHERNMGSGLELSGRRCDGSNYPSEILLTLLVEGGELFTVVMVRAADVNPTRQISPIDRR